MIKLRSLLEQSTDSTSTESKIPYVLFLGDAYTKSKSSYANVLIRSKLVEGRVIAWPNINLKQMNRLLKRYNNKKYSIVSMLFGDDIIKKINAESINTELNQLFNTAAQFGAKVVVVQNSVKQFPEQSSLLNDAIENESDLIISNVSALNIPNTHAKIAKRWLRDVDTTFKLNLKSNDAQIDAAADGTESSGNDIESDIVDSNDVIQPSNDTPVTGNFSDSVVNQAYDMIIPHEGFNPQPEIDLFFDDEGKKHGDGYCRIGYGSSHITRADGTVIDLGKPAAGKTCAQTYPYTIEIADAQRDLRRLIKDTFIPMVKRIVKQWGGDISKLNDATIATLVSVTYNYGHMPTELKPSIAASDPEAIGNALLTQFVQSTSNPKRRKKEGQYILNSLKSQPGLFKQAVDAVKNKLGLGSDSLNVDAATVSPSELSTSAVGSNTYGIPGASTGGEGGNWGGSMGRVLAFAKVAKDTMGKNYAGSQKRGTKLTRSKNISDHYINNEIAYAVDMGVRSLEEGDQLLANLMTWFGHPEYKGRYWFNVTKDGYRYQVGWRVPDHYDHVHIGVKRVGKSKDIPVDQLNKTQQDILAVNPKAPAGE